MGVTQRHISFDFWNTLAISNPEYATARLEIISSYYPNATYQNITDAYAETKLVLDDLAQYAGKGLTTVEAWKLFLGKIGISLFDNNNFIYQIIREAEQAFQLYPPHVHDNTVKKVLELKSLGHELYVISNVAYTSGFTVRKFIDKRFGKDIFTKTVFSDMLGDAKPHPNIFNTAFPFVNAVRDKALHIGDNRICDILGASNVGIKAQLLTNFTDLPKVIDKIIEEDHE